MKVLLIAFGYFWYSFVSNMMESFNDGPISSFDSFRGILGVFAYFGWIFILFGLIGLILGPIRAKQLARERDEFYESLENY